MKKNGGVNQELFQVIFVHEVTLIAMQLLNESMNIQISRNPQLSIHVIPAEFSWNGYRECFIHVCCPSYAAVYFLTHLSLMANPR